MTQRVLFVLALCALLPTQLKAQTTDETLEWLKAKQTTISRPQAGPVPDVRFGAKLGFDPTVLKVWTTSDHWIMLMWSNITDVRAQKQWVTVTAKDDCGPGKCFISFYVSDPELAPKYVKALKHMATLWGAKLVKDDLF